jgi:hypothetical protein
MDSVVLLIMASAVFIAIILAWRRRGAMVRLLAEFFDLTQKLLSPPHFAGCEGGYARRLDRPRGI